MFHPLMRVWIEICHYLYDYHHRLLFHPLMRVWIEMPRHDEASTPKFKVSPSYEGVD